MAWTQQQTPTPGHPVPRGGKPYIWATWLAKLLGGEQCNWKVWFLSRYRHAKQLEENADQLAEWNREHNQMMRERKALLEQEGWQVQTERDFKLEGQTAIIAGKEDLVATMPGHVLIVDGKTGRRRDSDFWQVIVYLYARLHAPTKPDERIKLAGEVFYKHGRPIDVRVADVQRHEPALVQMVQLIAGGATPARNPSKYECARCTIRREDCPDRYQEATAGDLVHTDAF